MCENPISLEDMCLNVICDNILTYIEPQIYTKDGWTSNFEDCTDCNHDVQCHKRYKFRDPDIFLINNISEKLLNKMMEHHLLCDATLNIFTKSNTNLRSVKIKNCRVTKCGLEILKRHHIVDLEISNLKNVNLYDVFDCLSDWSKQNLRTLIVTDSPTPHQFSYKLSDFIKWAKLKSLTTLNISYTQQLDLPSLKALCEHFKTLEKLDLSGTGLVYLQPLEMLSNKLVSLSLCDLVDCSEYLIPTLEQLSNLKFLDISLVNEKVDTESWRQLSMFDFLEVRNILPNLEFLDVSGWKEIIPKNTLLSFIEHHPKLVFLGLVLTSVTFDPVFSEPTSEMLQNLNIAGLGNEIQILMALQYYKDRYNYVQRALYHLFQLTNSFGQPRPDVFKLVLPAMETHSGRFGVQMAATACLYNLTRGELSKHIHPQTLSRGVNLTLMAMEAFPHDFQLQKNSLLTLCSDRILQEVSFDRFRCAKLVLDALCGFEEVNMNRMAVAICSILASKVSTDETSELGARPIYMRKLLSMVQSRTESVMADITLKFTLSALWNLTDESAATCAVFLEQGGHFLYLDVLKNFKGIAHIETKVLGLLNNIAEVIRLRQQLISDDLMDALYRLMKSDNIDVSYFAAGIVAHLTSDGEQAWQTCWTDDNAFPTNVSTYTRSEMLESLAEAVAQWKVPDSEMVTYRSFRPFFPLLRVEMDYQVQLWAVWAVHHVCTKNPNRYCRMLYEEDGLSLLSDLINYGATHPDIRQISRQILEAVKEQGVPP